MAKETSRWTYIHGSRPEGVVVYDDDTKLHSHHDTDPARGQCNVFDLIRLHKFGALDAGIDQATSVTDRPSYAAMVEWANSDAKVRSLRARTEFVDLGPLPPDEESVNAGSTTTFVASEQAAGSRFRVYSASDFSGGSPLEWLVRGVLPRAEVAVIFGESGSGKTFLTLDLCAAISRGLAWRERRTTRGGVVYVCAEGRSGFKARLRAYAHEHKVPLSELPAVIPDAPNLLDPKEAAALTHSIVDWVSAHGPVDVVVVDTLSATVPGGNENSGEDMGLVLSHCKLINRKTGALVILIHHSGKDATKGARGWSGLRAAADAEIEVTRNGDYRSATITKMKDGTDGTVFSFKLKVVDLGFGVDEEPESSCVVEHTETDAPKATKKHKLGPRETILLDLLKTMAPSGTVNEEDVIEGYKAKVPRPEGDRDQRRGHAKQALTALIAKKLAFKHGEDRVSLSSLVVSGNEGWLE